MSAQDLEMPENYMKTFKDIETMQTILLFFP